MTKEELGPTWAQLRPFIADVAKTYPNPHIVEGINFYEWSGMQLTVLTRRGQNAENEDLLNRHVKLLRKVWRKLKKQYGKDLISVRIIAVHSDGGYPVGIYLNHSGSGVLPFYHA